MQGVGDVSDTLTDGDDVPWVHTPFEQPWWLEAVAPGRWGETVVERRGEIVARLPYMSKQKLGLTVLTRSRR